MGSMLSVQPPDAAMTLALTEIEESLSPSVLSTVAAPYEILAVNEAWMRLCGYTSDEAVGQTFKDLLHGPATSEATASAFVEQLQRDRSAFCELTNYTKARQPFLHNLSSRRIDDPDSGRAYYITISHAREIPSSGVADVL